MLISIFKRKTIIPSTDFSKFFVLSKADEKKRILKEVIKKANNDQKLLYQSA